MSIMAISSNPSNFSISYLQFKCISVSLVMGARKASQDLKATRKKRIKCILKMLAQDHYLKLTLLNIIFSIYYTEKPTFNAPKPWETQRKSSRLPRLLMGLTFFNIFNLLNARLTKLVMSLI